MGESRSSSTGGGFPALTDCTDKESCTALPYYHNSVMYTLADFLGLTLQTSPCECCPRRVKWAERENWRVDVPDEE